MLKVSKRILVILLKPNFIIKQQRKILFKKNLPMIGKRLNSDEFKNALEYVYKYLYIKCLRA